MHGVISAGGPETAAAGAAMLRRGGNAVDAAVAAAFTSFIAEIGVVHFGGSGIAQIYDGQTGENFVYDFFSAMPGLGANGLPANRDFKEVAIDFGATTQSFHLGRASVAVPGAVIGLCQLARDHGRLPLATLLEPARRYATEGVKLAPFQAATCRLLAPLYTHTAGMRRIFMREGRIIGAGERLFIPDLAATLDQLATAGANLVRSGSLGQAIVADQAANGGLVTAADLAGYEVERSPAIPLRYHGYEIRLPGGTSTGGVLNAFSLKLLHDFEVGRRAYGSPDHLILFFEVMAATSRARPRWEALRKLHGAATAVTHFLADDFVRPFIDEIRAAIRGGQPSPVGPAPRGPGNTSHLSVIDGDGLAVSLTTTAGESAGYVVPGTGFIPNNILGEEDLNPHGFHQWPAGKRIPTMMTPTIVLEEENVRLVLGSGGSERIRSAIVQVLSNLLDFGLTLDEAVNRSRYHVENGVLQCEAGFDETAVAEVERRGYRVNRWPTRSIYFGGAHSVSRTADGRLVAAGDDRRGGSTAVA